MSRSSYSVNNKVHPAPLGNPDPYLAIEKSLELNGQQWVENVNIIEEILVQTIRRLGRDYPQLKSTFIVRRLPNFMIPYTNKNEYAVVLEKINFSLASHDPQDKSSTDQPGKPNFGQVEIYLPRKSSREDYGAQTVYETESDKEPSGKPETMSDCHVFLAPNKAYYSHQVFQAFATAFTKTLQSLDNEKLSSDIPHVQLVGPHLLKELCCHPSVPKIFRLISEPPVRLQNMLSHCKTTVDHLKSTITVTYHTTEVVIRPCLFYEHGYHRVNANVTERVPLYHPAMLTIAEALLKGCLLFPTSFETLWNLEFWPSENHLTCLFHPSSVMLRVYKIYGAFCVNPRHLLETLQTNFLCGGLEDAHGEEEEKTMPMDFLVSSFLGELEEFSRVDDWAPRNFGTRLVHLMKTAVDGFDKGFHSNYFTKINVLRGLWGKGGDTGNMEYNGSRETRIVLKDLEGIRESPDNLEDYKDINIPQFMETNDLEDEFGLKFEELDIHERGSPPKLTSDLVYSGVNPFGEDVTPSRAPTASKGTTKSLANFLKKFGSRPSSEAGGSLRSRRGGVGEKCSPPHTVRSMAEVACEFEKSVALQRARPSLFPFPISENPGISIQNLVAKPEPGPSSEQYYDNDAFDQCSNASGHKDSIYHSMVQLIKELPLNHLDIEDPEIHEYLEKMKKTMETQEELVVSWGKAMSDAPKPKFICPHAFSTRQIQYLAQVIHVVSRCSPCTIKIVRNSQLPSWEISGDILRIVLHQMRTENVNNANLVHNPPGTKQVPKKSSSFFITRTKSFLPGPRVLRSFKSNPVGCVEDPCKLHNHEGHSSQDIRQLDPEEEMQMAMEDPETAATNRLLQWLWQLRTSKIGRLSCRANRYLDELYNVSMVNSHFLEQQAEGKCFENLAIRSAVAVTKIMEMGTFPANIPLTAASKKGWLWAEMVTSLASWNQDKGIPMMALIPAEKDLIRVITAEPVITSTPPPKKGPPLEPEPDLEAVTLAFHSELATPIGWYDIEDPRQPGPYTVPILIFSSLGYYKLWEMIPGNLVHALVRLQKFNSLQHVGNMLTHPHRKTALNEVRKLNKSTSFRTNYFEDTIMSKTFKRLASVRTSKGRRKGELHRPNGHNTTCLSCDQAGCNSPSSIVVMSVNTASSLTTTTTIARYHGREIECTKL